MAAWCMEFAQLVRDGRVLDVTQALDLACGYWQLFLNYGCLRDTKQATIVKLQTLDSMA
jgi:hypothetical protein